METCFQPKILCRKSSGSFGGLSVLGVAGYGVKKFVEVIWSVVADVFAGGVHDR